ncbi:unnamed protein product [Orchesella dallaii]|uniref:Uncharacterized protein n=1 Tax=Orchesella dallaii TaxID=48710 RepID=A0ABP1RIZ2_9HEXA
MANKDRWLSAPLYHDWPSRSFLSLPPIARTKRKVSAANNDDQLEIVPLKKFAGDSSLPEVPDDNSANEMQLVTEDKEMEVYDPELTLGPISDGNGNGNYVSSFQLQTFNGKEGDYDSGLLKNSMSTPGASLILSNEVQETLTRKQLNTELLLPMLINDKIARANSMAIVLWKPVVNHLLDYSKSQLVKEGEVESSNSKIPQAQALQSQEQIMLSTTTSNHNFNSSAEEDIFMELDEN